MPGLGTTVAPGAAADAGTRRWPARFLAGGAVLVAQLGLVAAVSHAGWLDGGLRADDVALARVDTPSLGGRVDSIRVETADGRVLPVRVAAGLLWPRRAVAQGEALSVEVSFSRWGPLRWLLGGSGRLHLDLVTPTTRAVGRALRVHPGDPVVVHFSDPVELVSLDVGGRRVRRVLDPPATSVPLGVRAEGAHAAGEAVASAAPRRWEQPTESVRVRWFPDRRGPMALVTPQRTLLPRQQLRLTFSQSLDSLFGQRLPHLSPATSGSWSRSDGHTLVFQPSGAGFPLAGTLEVQLPAAVQVVHGAAVAKASRTLRWQVAGGTTLRLQQLLAQLGYLPLSWQPRKASTPLSPAAQVRAALHPPAGRFRWRWPHVPPELSSRWRPGKANPVTDAALVAFEYAHRLPEDAQVSADVWHALLADAAGGFPSTSPYSFVVIGRGLPQTLTLWQNGAVVARSWVNTGTATSPTPLGSYPILRQDGATSYYDGDEPLHGARRPGYGKPQSRSGTELPPGVAAKVLPSLRVGTLVVVTD